MRQCRRWLLSALLLLGLVFPLTAQEAQEIALRAGRHPGFARVVVDWPAPVPYQLSQEEGHLRLTFEQPARFDLAGLDRGISDYLVLAESQTEPNGFSLRLTGPMAVEHRYWGGKLIIDLRAGAAEPIPEPAPETPPAQAQAAAQAAEATSPQPRRKPEASPQQEQSAAAPEAEAPALRRKPVTDVVEVAEPEAAQTAEAGPTQLLPEAEAEAARETRAEAPARPEAPTPNVRTPQTAEAEPAREVPPPQSTPAEARSVVAAPPPTRITRADFDLDIPPPGRAPAPERDVTLAFDWAQGAALAVFRRADRLWFIFDRVAPEDMAALIEKELPDYAPVFAIPVEGGTALALTPPGDLSAELSRDEGVWQATLKRGQEQPRTPLAVRLRRVSGRINLVIAAGSTGTQLDFVDPASGERFLVLPSHELGAGLQEMQVLPQFLALRSLQGVALVPLSGTLEIGRTAAGVSISPERHLIASDVERARPSEIPVPEFAPQRLLNLVAWRGDPDASLVSKRQTILRELAAAPPEEQGLWRLELARLNFAHGLAAEAGGALDLLEASDPRLLAAPEGLLLRGATALQMEDFATARDFLTHPALDDVWDAAPWRATLAALAQDWDYAAPLYAASRMLFLDYPETWQTRFSLLAAEAFIRTANPSDGRDLLLSLENDRAEGEALPFGLKSQIDFLEGLRLVQEEDSERAVEVWRRVADGAHAGARVRARMALLDLGLSEGTVTETQAIEELEHLSFAWRGDRFEFALLHRLGERYVAANRHRDALHAWRRAVTRFPELEPSEVVARKMRELFAEIFLTDLGLAVPPLQAVALYEEFRELSPAGEVGDTAITRLVDRLVEVDLLHAAVDLLDNQVRYRLSGLNKARIGARLAIVHLLDRNAEAALEALDISALEESAKLPADLALQRRHLRARSLSAVGRPEEGLASLAEDESRASLSLQLEIHWEQRNWVGAAQLLQRLAPSAPQGDAPDSEQSRLVLNRAVALLLGENRQALQDLAVTFGDWMAAGEDGDLFALLVKDLDPSEFRSISRRLSAVERAEAFIDRYRAQVETEGLSQVN